MALIGGPTPSLFSPMMSMFSPMNTSTSALGMLANGVLLPSLTGDLGGAGYAGIPSWGMGDVLSLVEGPMANLAQQWMMMAGSASAMAQAGAAASASSGGAAAAASADGGGAVATAKAEAA